MRRATLKLLVIGLFVSLCYLGTLYLSWLHNLSRATDRGWIEKQSRSYIDNRTVPTSTEVELVPSDESISHDVQGEVTPTTTPTTLTFDKVFPQQQGQEEQLTRCTIIDCDFENKNQHCQRVNYPYSASNPLLFHVYWKGNVHWMLPLLIKSYLVTQQLSLSKMIVWSPSSIEPSLQEESKNLNDGSSEESTLSPLAEMGMLRSRFPKNVEFQVLDKSELMRGTCMENNTLYDNLMSRTTAEFESDAVRVMLLNRLGGVWIDADVLFIRDLMPLIAVAQEFSSLLDEDLMNNHILHIYKGSGTGHKLTEALCAMIQPNPPVKPKFPSWLLNDGLSVYCNKYLNCSLTPVNRCLTDPQWLDDLPFCGPIVNPEEVHKKLARAFLLHHRLDDCKNYSSSHYLSRYITDVLQKMVTKFGSKEVT